MMPIAIDCDTLEGEDLDKTIQVLLDRRKEIFEKVEKNVSLHNISKRFLVM